MSPIPPQTVVYHRPSGRVGVVIADRYNLALADETTVVYDGETAFAGTPTAELEVIGPEDASADPKRCGGGTVNRCCVFLSCDQAREGGALGWVCNRFGPERDWLIARFLRHTSSGQRFPQRLYPACQSEEP